MEQKFRKKISEKNLKKISEKIWKKFRKKFEKIFKPYLLGITVHNEPKRWIEAKKICAREHSHLVTVDCGQKQQFVRELVRKLNPESEMWIGFNSRQMYWAWDSSESSATSYVNFRKAKYPELATCVYLDRSKSKTWRGSNCRRKRPFICEKDNIFPEYDFNSYKVEAKVEPNGLTRINLQTVFEAKGKGCPAFFLLKFWEERNINFKAHFIGIIEILGEKLTFFV